MRASISPCEEDNRLRNVCQRKTRSALLVAAFVLCCALARAQEVKPRVDMQSRGRLRHIQDVIKSDVTRNQEIDGLTLFDLPNIEGITSATGDGAETVLADLGGMGASTDLIAVYRIDHGDIKAAKFKDCKGHVSELGLFLEGASVTRSSSVTLSSTHHALFTLERGGIGEDGTGGTCDVHAYQWSAGLNMYVERASRVNDEVRCR